MDVRFRHHTQGSSVVCERKCPWLWSGVIVVLHDDDPGGSERIRQRLARRC